MSKRGNMHSGTKLKSVQQEAIDKTRLKKSVYIYIAVLFGFVLLFILLSFFVQQRNNAVPHFLNEKTITAQQISRS